MLIHIEAVMLYLPLGSNCQCYETTAEIVLVYTVTVNQDSQRVGKRNLCTQHLIKVIIL